MRLASKILIGSLFILSLIFILISSDTAEAESLANCDKCYLQLQATNYCQSCHSAGDDRVMQATTWSGGIDRAASSLCPAVKTISEELYYTERMLLAIDRGQGQLPASLDTGSMNSRLTSAEQTYSRLLDMPVTSLDAFVSEAQVLRFRLGKIYSQINQLLDQEKLTRILIFAGLVTLILLVSLAWGWMNAHKASISGGSSRSPFSLQPKIWLLLFLVFFLFSLPIFRGASQEVTETSLEQQEQQAVLDSALRSSDISDRELARSWMLAQAAAARYTLAPEEAARDLDAILMTAEDAYRNSFVIWGEAKSAQEAAIGEWAKEEKALFITSQLDAMRSRAWGLQLIAQEWIPIDPKKSAEILERAFQVAQDSVGDYYDLDARSIAVTYAGLDLSRSIEIINTVNSLYIKAWGLREIAAITGDSSILDLAVKTTKQISEPIFGAHALRELGIQTGQSSYYEEAKQILLGVEDDDVALAFAWADLIAASRDSSLLQQIDVAYPSARAFALLEIAQFDAAWTEAEKINDPYERARAQAEIVSRWGDAEFAQKIQIPVYRDLAMRNVSIKQRDVSLAKKIENVYYKVQALTALDETASAVELAPELNDKYPLVQLAEHLASQDVQVALPLVELMDREADKAQALRALAVSQRDQGLFERALAMALAARVRGDNLAPSFASLALGFDALKFNPEFAEQAFSQAFDIAWRMIIKYE